MSIISETEIFVDNFKNANLSSSSLFFLTHAHTDKMKGLSNYFGGVVYCTKVTKTLVKKMKKYENVRLKVIKENRWVEFEGVGRVKCVPVLHCAGSTAFIFCLKDGRNVLHTGDFRFTQGYVDLFSEYCVDEAGESIQFDKIIYDAKYNGEHQRFPTIAESAALVRECIEKCEIENPQVELRFNSKVGLEYIALQLVHRRSGLIHFPFLSKGFPTLFSLKPEAANIHMVNCGCKLPEDNKVTIILSAGGFSKDEEPEAAEAVFEKDMKFFEKVPGRVNTWRVCYSLHSSGEEIADFLDWSDKNAKENCEMCPLF
jgi:hypothetical protein